jgi:peroxiredoxin
MNFSILELKKLLPKLRADTTIKIKTGNDTIINNKESYQLEIKIPHRYIGRGSELIEAKNSDIDIFNYQLFVSKKNHLPIKFGMIYLENNGFKTTTFSNYKNLKREDSVWNYERISDEYLRFTYEEYFSRMQAKNSNSIGQKAPDWSLKNIENELVKLSEQKSELTLIEFWFPHCKGCVLAVPELNEIKEKFSSQKLSVYGIEFTNNKREYLINYIEEQNVKYPTLYMGKEVAERYGVYAAPTFYLIDKEGYIKKVIVGYEKGKLLSLINESL